MALSIELDHLDSFSPRVSDRNDVVLVHCHVDDATVVEVWNRLQYDELLVMVC